MKRVIGFVGVVVMALLIHGVVLAQSNPFLGTWNMDAEKSRFSPGPTPKSLTITFEAAGDGVKSTSQATGADGPSTSWSYTANYDGKDNPITGTGAPGGADTVALKRVSEYRTESTLKKGGKVVRTARLIVAKDGKVMKILAKGKNADGTVSSVVLVLDKQ
jgi:hypothetical protein